MTGSPAAERTVVALGRLRRRSSPAGERDLIRAAQRGSADALETLVRRHWPGALRAAYVIVHDRSAAEDVAQESMLAAVQALGRFDRRRPFAPWLHRIVTNCALDWIRAHQRRAEVELREDAHPDQVPPREVTLSDDVIRAMRVLSPEDRAIVAMAHLFGYRGKEIGQILGLRPGTVRSRLSRALARVRGELEGSRPTNSEVSR
jgi:RNA polymerase sigma-70 factor (ECF subfamily)